MVRKNGDLTASKLNSSIFSNLVSYCFGSCELEMLYYVKDNDKYVSL